MSGPTPELYMVRKTAPSAGGIPIHDGFDVHVGDRLVGRLSPTKRVFYVWRDELRHFARVAKGYGITKALADKLFARGTSLQAVVLTIHHESGRTIRYFTPMEAWRDQARTLTLSIDFEPQVFLSFTYIQELDRKYRARMNQYEGASSGVDLPLIA